MHVLLASPQSKKKKSRGKGKKPSTEESRGDDGEEDDREAVPALQKGEGREGGRGEGESLSKPSTLSLYPSWKRTSSDSEFSDPEGNAQSKLRYRKTLPVLELQGLIDYSIARELIPNYFDN